MLGRRTMKKTARSTLKRHYGIFVVMCLIAALGGTEFSYSMNALEVSVQTDVDGEGALSSDTALTGGAGLTAKFLDVLTGIARGEKEKKEKEADEEIQRHVQGTGKETNAVLGRSRGILSMMVNSLTSGAFFISLTLAVSSIVGSDNLAVIILILLSLSLLLALWIFVQNLYQVVMRRVFLEGRCYEKVHPRRAFFLLRVRKWVRAAMTMLVKAIYIALWSLTIVGGIIKHYSYFAVPYIVAENPSVTAKQAVTLSRRMMQGHKWECCKFELSFIGWYALNILTAGLVGIFFSNPYQIAAFSEYYTELRELAIDRKIEGYRLLDDKYLYEQSQDWVLDRTYEDVLTEEERPGDVWEQFTGIHRILGKVFGLTIWTSRKEREFEKTQAKVLSQASEMEAVRRLVYPTRLNPLHEIHRRKWVDSMNYVRCYSIWSVIIMFFIMSFVGWCWEVSFHLVTEGTFVNRGVLHGPWLPIYGSGSVLILLLLNFLRRKPALEFAGIVVLCGTIEYFTSYYLELLHGGKRWWDYSGYFLNLHGRICAEGLLTFGIGGMVIVYVMAPFLDNFIRQVPLKVLVLSSVILLCCFGTDQMYSRKHPNEGEGITSYTDGNSAEASWQKTMAGTP